MSELSFLAGVKTIKTTSDGVLEKHMRFYHQGQKTFRVIKKFIDTENPVMSIEKRNSLKDPYIFLTNIEDGEFKSAEKYISELI